MRRGRLPHLSLQIHSRDHYIRLPISKSPSRRSLQVSASRRRLLCIFVLCIPLLVWLIVYIRSAEFHKIWVNLKFATYSNLPPTYERFYEIEESYPQHNASLPSPEGRNGRFLWVSNQHHRLGWNNIFQNLYMLAHLAYLSNRAFVFEPYTWNEGPERYDTYNGHLIPSRIPLSALIDGPIAGGPFPPDKPNPRSVNARFFNQVCPEKRRTRISIKEMNRGLEGRPVIEILDKYASKLLAMSESCVELYGFMEHPFDYRQFGHFSMETVYPTLSQSPVLQEFKWSPLVLAALQTNAHGLSPDFSNYPPPNVVPDFMAIHLRRGDFVIHCQGLHNWSSHYQGWAQTPGLPDRFVPPPVGSEEREREYMRHCYPDISQIVQRVEEVRYEWETRDDRPGNEPLLKRLYILSNGQRGWLEALKRQLMEAGDWEVIVSSREMTLSPEQKYVAQAVDMAIAECAAVLLGNGVCVVFLLRTRFYYGGYTAFPSLAIVSGDVRLGRATWAAISARWKWCGSKYNAPRCKMIKHERAELTSRKILATPVV